MEDPISFKYDTVSNTSSDPPSPTRIAYRPEPETTVRYGECQRNHAACTGNRVLDGCGEFMPNGDVGTPESVRCAACGCHRQEIGGGGRMAALAAVLYKQQPRIFYQVPPRGGAIMMGFGGGAHGESSSDDGEGSRKRMRTKFTEEQKARMMEFAEKIGGRIPKEEGGGQVDKFCERVGVTRRVFKVWMHNNKLAIKRKV